MKLTSIQSSEAEAIRIGIVDCDANPQLCQLFNVTSFPKLKLIRHSQPNVFRNYDGQRDIESLLNFVLETYKSESTHPLPPLPTFSDTRNSLPFKLEQILSSNWKQYVPEVVEFNLKKYILIWIPLSFVVGLYFGFSICFPFNKVRNSNNQQIKRQQQQTPQQQQQQRIQHSQKQSDRNNNTNTNTNNVDSQKNKKKKEEKKKQ